MSADNGKVRIYVGIPTNGPTDWTVNVRAEDAASGSVLFDMEIKPEDWVQICRGLVYNGDAFIGQNLDRVGKTMQVESVPIPRDVMERAGYQRDAMKAAAEDWAEQHCSGPDAPWASDGGPDDWDVRHQNTGWKILARRWIGGAS